MEYKIGEIVITISTNEVKTIVESEIISDVEIYYMDDLTSYSSTQIYSAENFMKENLMSLSKSMVSEMEQNFFNDLELL
jgi:diphthamide biosynthesis methyltransferase